MCHVRLNCIEVGIVKVCPKRQRSKSESGGRSVGGRSGEVSTITSTQSTQITQDTQIDLVVSAVVDLGYDFTREEVTDSMTSSVTSLHNNRVTDILGKNDINLDMLI